MTEVAPQLKASRTALLVMDYQNGIIERLPDPELLLDRARHAIDSVRRYGCQVGYVRVAFTDADFAAIPATSMMANRIASAGQAFHDDSPATAISERVTPVAGDLIVRKSRVGAFSTTDLHDQLRQRGIDTLILAGISTSGVVLSTVRDASDRDYRLLVLADCCADPEPDVHAFLTQRILSKQATVIEVGELDGLLAAAPS